jgi:hypothetical protein
MNSRSHIQPWTTSTHEVSTRFRWVADANVSSIARVGAVEQCQLRRPDGWPGALPAHRAVAGVDLAVAA